MKFHTISIEDREMFAYNAEHNRRKEAMQKHFNWIENPIRYCLEFMGHDVDTDAKCYQGLYSNLEKCYDPELHF